MDDNKFFNIFKNTKRSKIREFFDYWFYGESYYKGYNEDKINIKINGKFISLSEIRNT
jgi:hypothetical protein